MPDRSSEFCIPYPFTALLCWRRALPHQGYRRIFASCESSLHDFWVAERFAFRKSHTAYLCSCMQLIAEVRSVLNILGFNCCPCLECFVSELADDQKL
mmetsp:Transcript_74993/g.243735  ORF Transcript_74993/g.243735 Transcript_74993/m.243735 type:complete len:98 (-) Transcript_74993:47-340(-)